MAAETTKKVEHGGYWKRKHEKTEKYMLDFSASVNPFPPFVSWNCDKSFLEHYPDDSYTCLKEVIAGIFRREPEEICVGNGSIELIRICCHVILRNRRTFYTETPTFGEYAFSAALAEGRQVEQISKAELTFICNPNNPTGTLRSRDAMRSILADVEKSGGVLCSDEAFIELSDQTQSLVLTQSDNLIVLRSLTKCFSVPGIRFGYGFGNPDLIDRIEAARLPWTVNAYAEAFALQAFRHFGELAESQQRISRERSILCSELGDLGLIYTPSDANFLLVETGKDVHQLCRKLEARGILVRNCTSFGLPTKIRVAVRSRDENRTLVEALAACLP